MSDDLLTRVVDLIDDPLIDILGDAWERDLMADIYGAGFRCISIVIEDVLPVM